MKKVLLKLIYTVFDKNRIRGFFLKDILNAGVLPHQQELIFNTLREKLIEEYFKYPSTFNNGYLHIQRAITIISDRKLEGMNIIDIGAAGGETCIMLSKAFPQATVIGFEPISTTFKRLQKNTEGYKNIQIHNNALGSDNKSSFINVMSRITASSIYSSQEGSSLNGNNFFEIEGKEEIVVKRLDDCAIIDQEIALIKMDVQGYEEEVLKGASNTLCKTHFILLEMQTHDIYVGAPKYYRLDEFLRNKGFELFDIIPSIREKGQIKEFDALYINKALEDS